MAISLTHTTQSAEPDSGVAGEISSSEWNEAHTLAMATKKALGRVSSGDGAVEEIDLGRLGEYTGTSEPSAPADGLTLFSHDSSAWPVLCGRGVAGRALPVNPFMGRGSFGAIIGGSAVTVLGTSASSSNTTPLGVDGTSTFRSLAAMGIQTTATASSTGNLRAGISWIIFRGSSAVTGLRLAMTGGLHTLGNSNCRWFFGLMATASAVAATFDPATATNIFGVGCSGADTNAQIYRNDGSGSAVATDLGANYPGKTALSAFIELRVWIAGSAATTAYYEVRRLDDLTIAPVTGSFNTNIPDANTAMYPYWVINNNATAANSILAAGSAFWETGI